MISTDTPLTLSVPAETPRSAAPAPIDLATVGLRKAFGGVSLLKEVTLDLKRGESVALVGANGSGKSTLLRCCLGLLPPDAGSVSVLGENLFALRRRALRRTRGQVGVIWQRHNLVPRLTALSNVLHGAQCRSTDPRLWYSALAPAVMQQHALACLETVGIAHLAQRRADHLSGGESQRVAIARSLMQRPRLVLADEPAASLDPRSGEEVMDLLVSQLQERGISLLFISHDLDHALAYADRILGLDDGRIVFDVAAASVTKADLRGLYG